MRFPNIKYNRWGRIFWKQDNYPASHPVLHSPFLTIHRPDLLGEGRGGQSMLQDISWFPQQALTRSFSVELFSRKSILEEKDRDVKVTFIITKSGFQHSSTRQPFPLPLNIHHPSQWLPSSFLPFLWSRTLLVQLNMGSLECISGTRLSVWEDVRVL